MGVLKHYYSEEVRRFLGANGRSVTHCDISDLFGRIYLKAQMGETAVNGLRGKQQLLLVSKDVLSPPPTASNVTTKRGRPKGTSNVITSSTFRNITSVRKKWN